MPVDSIYALKTDIKIENRGTDIEEQNDLNAMYACFAQSSGCLIKTKTMTCESTCQHLLIAYRQHISYYSHRCTPKLKKKK